MIPYFDDPFNGLNFKIDFTDCMANCDLCKVVRERLFWISTLFRGCVRTAISDANERELAYMRFGKEMKENISIVSLFNRIPSEEDMREVEHQLYQKRLGNRKYNNSDYSDKKNARILRRLESQSREHLEKCKTCEVFWEKYEDIFGMSMILIDNEYNKFNELIAHEITALAVKKEDTEKSKEVVCFLRYQIANSVCEVNDSMYQNAYFKLYGKFDDDKIWETVFKKEVIQ